MNNNCNIGIFDSGYGGLTVFKEIVHTLPQYNYIYIGDNSRAPYGSKSFENVLAYTWQCVEWLIQQRCTLIILACNTASARALRSIQQNQLLAYPQVRVLGVIRPTAEIIGQYSSSKEIGIVGTEGTIKSKTYLLEIEKFFPEVKVFQLACKLWVPIIESDHFLHEDVDAIINSDLEQLLAQSPHIDTILLACTHYPLLIEIIQKFVPAPIRIISQGAIIAKSLSDYLHRHVDIESSLGQDRQRRFYTTDDPIVFEEKATSFYGETIKAALVKL